MQKKKNQISGEIFYSALENHKKNNFQIAEKLYKNLLQNNPNHFDSNFLLGSLFIQTKNFNSAQKLLEKAIQINPKHADAHNNLGILFKELGEFKKAISCYEKAIKYKPDNLVYLYHLSELKKEILNLSLKEKIDTIINNVSCSKKNMAYGNLLLSNYELNLKKYENEFKLLIKGHFYYFESQKEKYDEEVNYWLNVLPTTKKIFSFSKKKNEKNDCVIKPIFIIGTPRCGSTLIERIITSGSKFVSVGEEKGVIGKTVRELISNNRLLPEDIKKIIYKKYKSIGLIQEKNDYIFTDKSLDNFFYLNFIKEFFPEAKVINCKRNSLSSIMSILKNNLVDIPWAHNLNHIFKYFDNYYKIIENFKKKFPKFIYDLQYEDFVSDPENESKKLLKFCNLPWDKKCLEFYKRNEHISKTASNIQIRNPIFKETASKYLPYKKFLNEYGSTYSWFIKDSE